MENKYEWVRVATTGVAPVTCTYQLVDEKGKVIAKIGYSMYSDGKKWHLFGKILLVYKGRKGRRKEKVEFNNFEELNQFLKQLGLPEF